MSGTRGPRLGPAIYRCLDGVTDLACIITLVEPESAEAYAAGHGANLCCVTAFPPGSAPQFYTRVRFDRNAGPQSAKPGTCYCW